MPAKRIDSGKLLDLVCAIEGRYGSVVNAPPAVMKPIWELTKVPVKSGRQRVQVTQQQYWVIENYNRVPAHTSLQKAATLRQLGHGYDWLRRRLRDYRLGVLEVKDGAQN